MGMLSFRRFSILAATLALALVQDGRAQDLGIPANSAPSTQAKTRNPLGINLAAVAYYSPEQPFLNIIKSGGSSSALSNTIGWYTAASNTWGTQEESYLQLDPDGYPTSLTASPTPPRGQQFTFVKAVLNYNLPKLAPGQTAAYPPGT